MDQGGLAGMAAALTAFAALCYGDCVCGRCGSRAFSRHASEAGGVATNDFCVMVGVRFSPPVGVGRESPS